MLFLHVFAPFAATSLAGGGGAGTALSLQTEPKVQAEDCAGLVAMMNNHVGLTKTWGIIAVFVRGDDDKP